MRLQSCLVVAVALMLGLAQVGAHCLDQVPSSPSCGAEPEGVLGPESLGMGWEEAEVSLGLCCVSWHCALCRLPPHRGQALLGHFESIFFCIAAHLCLQSPGSGH